MLIDREIIFIILIVSSFLFIIYLFSKLINNKVDIIECYEQAAINGCIKHQLLLAEMYYYGHGIKQDYKEAFKWYNKVAEKGYAIAQYNIALMYYYGFGVEKNYDIALKYISSAAEQGYFPAKKIMDFGFDCLK